MKKLFSRSIAFIMALLLSFTVFSPFAGRGAVTEYVDTSGYESLKEVYKDYFKVGMGCEAISHWHYAQKEIGNPAKEALISAQFNSITCGNELKPAYNFSKDSETLFKIDHSGKEMMQWAKDNGIGMRFHVLLWHSQVSPAFFAKDFKPTSKGITTTSDKAVLDEECLVDRETLIERMRLYIYGALEYVYANGFAQTVYAIDVVNEAVEENNPDGLRNSYWYKIIGPEFLYYAFLFAREAEVKYSKEYASLYGLDPEGDLSSILPKLFYNDYNEWFTARVNVITDFITNRAWNKDQQMIKSSVIKEGGNGTLAGDGLIDGIGMQGHLSDNNVIKEYMAALRQYSSIVDEVHITELDVKCTHHDENQWYYQAKFYYDFFKALVEEVKNGVNLTAVTIWGLTDDTSWISDGYPLLFTYNLTAKPSYYGVLLAGKGEEFNLKVSQTITDLKDIEIHFEPYKDEYGASVNYTPKSAGFQSRGSGHMPYLRMIAKVNHTENATIGFCLACERSEQDATCMLDISKFAGKNITFTAYVKTEDTEIAVGLDFGESTELKRVSSSGDWTPVSFNADIPAELDSVGIYFETNGHSDIFIDDVSVIYTRDGEDPAPITDTDSSTPEPTLTPTEEPSATPAETITEAPKDDGKAADTIVTPTPSVGQTDKKDTSSESFWTGSTIIAAILICIGAAFFIVGLVVIIKSKKNKKKNG